MAEEKIGVVTHYFGKIGVAAIELTDGMLRVGDTIHVKGHTSDFTQTVDSMQMEHDRLHKLMDKLSERERAVLRIRYGFESEGEFRTLEETGKAFGVTRERARQIEMKALRKLRLLLTSEEQSTNFASPNQ